MQTLNGVGVDELRENLQDRPAYAQRSQSSAAAVTCDRDGDANLTAANHHNAAAGDDAVQAEATATFVAADAVARGHSAPPSPLNYTAASVARHWRSRIATDGATLAHTMTVNLATGSVNVWRVKQHSIRALEVMALQNDIILSNPMRVVNVTDKQKRLVSYSWSGQTRILQICPLCAHFAGGYRRAAPGPGKEAGTDKGRTPRGMQTSGETACTDPISAPCTGSIG